ncbi:hypothetical protein GF324_02780 [bacterium]|nr:hypothetical protein [bacterium]
MSSREEGKTTGPKQDPLRAVWIAYWRQVTLEGVLLIVGLFAWIFTVNMLLQVFGFRDGLGWFLYVLVAGLLYLAAGWVIKPFIRLRHAPRSPRASRLPDAVEVIVPSLRGRTEKEMRSTLEQGKPGRHLPKRRLLLFALFSAPGVFVFLFLSLL